MTDPIASEPLIRVEGLTVEFPVRGSVVRAVDAVSFDVGRGEIVGLVGESASGKSTLGLSLLRMVPSPGRVRADRLEFDGRDLLALSESQMRAIRGSEIALIVQDALATMNPVTTGMTPPSNIGPRRECALARVSSMIGSASPNWSSVTMSSVA